ncbi:DUF6965 family protein [Sphingobacterium spiritivorum]|uniref:DUF6965 family protein n=1 Tax=Sphingobacterium spiritivorum TaxID=258 RepID=UPI003DA6C9D3
MAIFAAMDAAELKQYFSSRELPTEIRIAPHMVVTNVPEFLRISFICVDMWEKDVEKCPSWVRLQLLRDAIEQ